MPIDPQEDIDKKNSIVLSASEEDYFLHSFAYENVLRFKYCNNILYIWDSNVI